MNTLYWIKNKENNNLMAHGMLTYAILFSGSYYYLASKLDEAQEKISGPYATESKAKDMAEKIESKFNHGIVRLAK
jgi:hypothetical protein